MARETVQSDALLNMAMAVRVSQVIKSIFPLAIGFNPVRRRTVTHNQSVHNGR